MEYYETKIGRIIEEEFDSRLEASVFNYIISYGIDNVMELKDEEIKEMEDNGVCRALMKCAVRICQECDVSEIMEYIRKYGFWAERKKV